MNPVFLLDENSVSDLGLQIYCCFFEFGDGFCAMSDVDSEYTASDYTETEAEVDRDEAEEDHSFPVEQIMDVLDVRNKGQPMAPDRLIW